jgi:uncharacterized protein YndB with AHSA1/START domain
MAQSSASNRAADGLGVEVKLTRVFDAPRRLVFQVWTDPKHVAQWWGPHGFTSPRCEWDARTGGAIHIDMRGPDARIYPMAGTFQEVLEPERLVFTCSALDEVGHPLFEVETIVSFAERGGKTSLTMQARVVKSTAGVMQYIQGMEAGWTQSLERLEAYLAKAAR